MLRRLEQATVDDAPNFIDAVAEDEAAIFDGDGRGRPWEVLPVQISEHSAEPQGSLLKLMSRLGASTPSSAESAGAGPSSSCGGWSLTHALLPLPGEVRRDAEHTLDQ